MWLLMLSLNSVVLYKVLKVQVFCHVMLCCMAGHSPCFEGASCLILQLDHEGEGAMILLKHFELSTQEQCHIPDDMIQLDPECEGAIILLKHLELCPRAVSHPR
jgi:hypothetical protein